MTGVQTCALPILCCAMSDLKNLPLEIDSFSNTEFLVNYAARYFGTVFEASHLPLLYLVTS